MQIRVQKSMRRDKKLMAIIDQHQIHFGAVGYEDFTTHKDAARKAQYLARHRPTEVWTLAGIKSAGFWSRWLLWGEPTLRASVSALNTRYPAIHVTLRG